MTQKRAHLEPQVLLTGLGLDVLIFDYRGYAENDGSPSENGLALDARAAWDFAAAQPEEGWGARWVAE